MRRNPVRYNSPSSSIDTSETWRGYSWGVCQGRPVPRNPAPLGQLLLAHHRPLTCQSQTDFRERPKSAATATPSPVLISVGRLLQGRNYTPKRVEVTSINRRVGTGVGHGNRTGANIHFDVANPPHRGTARPDSNAGRLAEGIEFGGGGQAATKPAQVEKAVLPSSVPRTVSSMHLPPKDRASAGQLTLSAEGSWRSTLSAARLASLTGGRIDHQGRFALRHARPKRPRARGRIV